MTKVEDLQKKLYESGSDEELKRRMQYREHFPETMRRPQASWEEPGYAPPVQKQSLFERKLFWPILGGFILVLIIGMATFLFLYLGTRGQEVRLALHDQGPLISGEARTIPVSMHNTSHTTVQDVELALVLPPGSVIQQGNQETVVPSRFVEKLDDLKPDEERVVEITTRIFGKEGDQKNIEAVLLYRPQNLQARFTTRAAETLLVASVPLAVSWEVPQTVSRGQNVDVKVHYVSSARLPFEHMSLRLEYPDGFSFASADPAPAKDTMLWDLGTLSPGAGGDITIHGTLSGQDGDIKAFHGMLGVFNGANEEFMIYSEASSETRIAAAPLSVQAFFNDKREGVVGEGDSVAFTLRYRNNTLSLLKNITIRASLEEFFNASGALDTLTRFERGEYRIYDFPSLRIQDAGIYDGQTRTLIWAPANVTGLRELAPGQGGQVSILVDLRKTPILRNAGEKNLAAGISAHIEAGEQPSELAGTDLTANDALRLKVRSHVVFAGRAVYHASPILNSGPLPPEVGKKTTYTILLEARSFSNTLQNVVVSTTLPSHVHWEEKTFPQSARMTFDRGTQDLIWNIGEIPAGTGIFSPALTAAFQASITPSEFDRGKIIELVRDVKLIGIDSFTGQPVEQHIGSLTIELKNDTPANPKEWLVK
ncbi:MAG: hypothetical protein HY007_00500 [Candidatus Sungbacteria bacterium]|nr:hypothetical protein [Candidatus Sungbacteria bacterium]